MKLLFAVITASVITFQGCNEAQPYEDASLTVVPEYSGGTLYITPVITHEGGTESSYHFGDSIARIVEITEGDEVLFRAEEEPVEVDQMTVLGNEEERTGTTVDLEIEPGTYTVRAEAEFNIVEDENTDPTQHRHELRQQIELQNGSSD